MTYRTKSTPLRLKHPSDGSGTFTAIVSTFGPPPDAENDNREIAELMTGVLGTVPSSGWSNKGMPGHRRGARGALPVAASVVALVLWLGADTPAVAAFPGDNGVLAMVREGDVRGIWTLDHLALTRLTHREDYRPRWSPDGSRIVFQRFEGSPPHSNIFVMDADGSDVRQLTRKGGFPPAWSPDSSMIVFGSERDGDEEIFLMSADGSNERNLTRNTFADFTPAWSPDGTRIAFASRRHGNTDLYLVAPDASDEVRLTHDDAQDRDPDWAPDGSRLAFQSNRHGWDIYVKDVQHRAPVRMTNGRSLDWAPAWSPDGTQIAYTRLRGGVQDVVILDLASGDRLRLTMKGTSEVEPNWQPL
jgi:Tol biopolymer transport system component